MISPFGEGHPSHDTCLEKAAPLFLVSFGGYSHLTSLARSTSKIRLHWESGEPYWGRLTLSTSFRQP